VLVRRLINFDVIHEPPFSRRDPNDATTSPINSNDGLSRQAQPH
jgi:hypothetical protein